jgi:tetratricopeptide (TPR) repeat protein
MFIKRRRYSMFRFGRLTLALAFLVLLPTVASAQRDTRYTREASKFIGLAMTRQDPTQKVEYYRQAMTHLQEGMERDAENAKVWLLAGSVHAALGEMQEADQAFQRAMQMHPAYAEEIASEREAAWIDAFNAGLELMDAQQYDAAIAKMEAAQLIYNQRPEALMNLGALYANAGEPTKSIRAFEQAVEATNGPLAGQIDEETREAWARYRVMASVNVAQMLAAQGVEQFNAQEYDAALVSFRRATDTNPQSRDYWFNTMQALWAQVNEHEDALEADEANAAARAALPAMYTTALELVEKARAFDPTNEILFRIEAQAKRMQGVLRGGAPGLQAGQEAALAVLQRMDALEVTLDNVVVYSDGEGAVIQGVLKNRKAAAGTPIQLQFSLLGLDGSVIGSETITVTAPAADTEVEFQGRATVDGELAGWRYRIGN